MRSKILPHDMDGVNHWPQISLGYGYKRDEGWQKRQTILHNAGYQFYVIRKGPWKLMQGEVK